MQFNKLSHNLKQLVFLPIARVNKRQLLSLLFLCILMIISWFILMAPVGNGKRQIEYTIHSGAKAVHVAQELEQQQIISSSTLFRLYLKLTGRSSKIQVGTYELNDGMQLNKIVKILSSGKVKLHSITIPEGWNNRQIGDFLQKKELIGSREAFLQLSRDPNLLAQYNILTGSTEGYLYPETYKIPANYSAAKLHKLMLDKFFATLHQITNVRDYNPEQLQKRIILASIVEREARHPAERPIIAQVFLNRIRKKMKLESCATVQYLFEKPKAKLYWQDLERPSPYNTYLHYGWPPAPISNPGKAALQAAFTPQKNDYLFFVVKPDGSHHFSATYLEHIQAKKKYIDSDIVIDR